MSELYDLRKSIVNNSMIDRNLNLNNRSNSSSQLDDEDVELALLAIFGAGLTLSRNPILSPAGTVILAYSVYKQYQAMLTKVYERAMKNDKKFREAVDRYNKGESYISGDRFGG